MLRSGHAEPAGRTIPVNLLSCHSLVWLRPSEWMRGWRAEPGEHTTLAAEPQDASLEPVVDTRDE